MHHSPHSVRSTEGVGVMYYSPHSVRSTERSRQAHTSLSKQLEVDHVSTCIPGAASNKGLLSGYITWNNMQIWPWSTE